MCEACQHINIYAKVKQFDPTHTTSLRNAFANDMSKRFKKLIALIEDAIVTKDVFGLQNKLFSINAATPNQFAFSTSDAKVQAFMEWLRQMVQQELLTIKMMSQVGTGLNQAWTNMYVEDSYKRGIARAKYEMKKAGYLLPEDIFDKSVAASFNNPFHMDRVGMLYSRVYSDLKGITDQMDTQISKVLAQGMIDGENPRTMARKMRAVIEGGGEELGITDTLGRFIPAKRRAEILARTETVRAYHQANIQEMKNWGIEGVSVVAEWSTAEDDRVCDKCKAMTIDENGELRIYTLDEIQNLIPLHPNCRCLALPVSATEEIKNKLLQKQKQQQQKKESISKLSKHIPTTFEEQLKYVKENWNVDYEELRNFDMTLEEAIEQMKDFNFQQVDEEIKSYLQKYGMNPDSMHKPKLTIDFSGMDDGLLLDWRGTGFRFSRIFYPDGTVSHDFFSLAEKYQRNGFSKDLLKTLYVQYKAMNLNAIRLEANINVGGYAWGRYGFTCDAQDALRLLEWQASTPATISMKNKAQKIWDDFYEKNNHDYSIRFPMNLWADAEFGKKLLLGSQWIGELDLNDPVQAKRFVDYMTQMTRTQYK